MGGVDSQEHHGIAVVQLVINGAIVYYLLRLEVKRAFGRLNDSSNENPRRRTAREKFCFLCVGFTILTQKRCCTSLDKIPLRLSVESVVINRGYSKQYKPRY
jgi:hypothetical protein